jgi:SAM-dependent methyltransferase
MPKKPLALDAYERLAEAYAAAVETKPHNAYYERPATLALLPEVAGRRVLDAGCGPGVYAEWLVARGARVVGVDVSPRMLALARERLGPAVELHEASLEEPLDFLDDASFDLVVSPLVLDYVEDWRATFAEFHRVLRPGGRFVFSFSHPFFDFTYFGSSDYFAVERVGSEWRGFAPLRVYVPCYRRPLGAAIGPLLDAGFALERLVEPRPTADFAAADPKHHAELSTRPGFLCIRARKADTSRA